MEEASKERKSTRRSDGQNGIFPIAGDVVLATDDDALEDVGCDIGWCLTVRRETSDGERTKDNEIGNSAWTAVPPTAVSTARGQWRLDSWATPTVDGGRADDIERQLQTELPTILNVNDKRGCNRDAGAMVATTMDGDAAHHGHGHVWAVAGTVLGRREMSVTAGTMLGTRRL